MKFACFLTLFLCSAFYAMAQDVPTPVWKKKVSRDVDIRDKYTGKLARSAVNDSTISQIIVNALITRKVAAYHPWWGRKMTNDDLLEVFYGKIDTQMTANYVIGYVPHTYKRHRFDADSLYKYRVYEEWNYYPWEGKMNAQITFVAPIKTIYGYDGNFRGEQPAAKLGYDDFMSLLRNKNDSDLCFPLFGNIWKSYFNMDTGKAITHSITPANIWHATAIRTIEMQEPADTQKHFLKNENDDRLLLDLIVAEIKNKELKAWSAEAEPFSRRLTMSHLDELIADRIDTIAIVDPVTKTEITRYARRSLDDATIHPYKILEDWVYDPITGKTEIAIKGIAPVRAIVNDSGRVTETKTMFWIQFTDLQKILSRAEQYHPDNTFAMHIWDSYFTTDTRPALAHH